MMDTTKTEEIFSNIEQLVQQDPGNRGLKHWALQGQLLPAMTSLHAADEVWILTGFYILSAGAVETDGPPGVAFLAAALEQTGKNVKVFTDDHAHEIVEFSLRAAGVKAEVLSWEQGKMPSFEQLRSDLLTHVIALERPGRAPNGKYHNFRGLDISDYVLPFDDLFEAAAEAGVVTIGIGDGGNELGMGNVSEAVSNSVAPHENFSCPISSRFCICAGVSNWAGYASAAGLSLLGGKSLLPDESLMLKVLEAGVEKGAVDGVSGKPEATVDGLPISWEKDIFNNLRQMVAQALSE